MNRDDRRMDPSAAPTIGVLIRFKDHAGPLADCLAGLDAQRRRPDLIVAVDTGSRDGSAELLRARGATIVRWDGPYQPSAVLNLGMERCACDHVLMLSAHVAMTDPDAIARMTAAFADPAIACVGVRAPGEGRLSERITMAELRAKRINLGSVYSNAFGMIARSRWLATRFDPAVDWIDDYDWALRRLAAGDACAYLEIPYRYRRDAPRPGHRSDFTRNARTMAAVVALARHHGLRIRWLGLPGTAWRAAAWGALLALSFGRHRAARTAWDLHWPRLWGRLTWRRHDPFAARARSG